jgi:uncharacterized protein (DUF433 family)
LGASGKGRKVIEPRVVDRGDGLKIAGTRITVYTVLEYLRAGRTRDWIAAMLNLSSQQVQAAIDYMDAHSDAVEAEYGKIMARIQAGNPPDVQALLRANREKVNARLNRRNGQQLELRKQFQ